MSDIQPYFEHDGFCPICEKEVVFSAKFSWFRDHLKCPECGSVPRERALMTVIIERFPNYRDIDVHESSPGGRGVSVRLRDQCARYSSSHFFPDYPRGEVNPIFGSRCEDLEQLTFADQSFDLFVTQDVMEHIFDPGRAFKEIARVLRPGGAHIFTVPLVNKWSPSVCRAVRGVNGEIEHLLPAQYHGNPVDENGSLVTFDWGYDICQTIFNHSAMHTVILKIDNLHLGIQAEYLEVLTSNR
jgi:SAM-dependent methyltransferase